MPKSRNHQCSTSLTIASGCRLASYIYMIFAENSFLHPALLNRGQNIAVRTPRKL
jgi:hypothetical protein